MVDLRLQTRLSLGSVIHRPAWSPYGDLLAAPTRDGSVYIFDLATEKIVSVLKLRGSRSVWANAVCWLDETELAVGYEDGIISRWNVAQQKTLARFLFHRQRIEDLNWSTSRQLLAAASGDGQVSIWSSSKSKPVKVLPHGYWVNSAVWSPKGDVLATGAEDNRVRLWTGPELAAVNIVIMDKDWITDLAWHPTRLILASTSHSSVHVWDGVHVREILATRREGRVRTVSFSADGNLLAAKREGGHVEFFETHNWTLVSVLEESTFFQDEPKLTPESRAVFHPIKSIICTLGDGHNALRIWNVDYDYQDAWLIAPTKRELIESATRVIDLCAEAAEIAPDAGRPGIGHNRPPTDELRDEAISLRVILQNESVQKSVVALSKSRFQRFVDILSDKTAESIAKSLGPAIVAGLIASVLAIVRLLDTLLKISP